MNTIENQTFFEKIIKINNFNKFKNVKSKLVLKKGNNDSNFTFSILIPTYKRIDLLKDAISSAINQTYSEPYEIIVLDNDEESNGEKIIQLINGIFSNDLLGKISIKYYINEKNIRMAGNWNRAIELSNGKFLIMCHDDDKLDKDVLFMASKKINPSDQNNGLSFVARKIDYRKKTIKLVLYSCIGNFMKCIGILSSSRKDKQLTLYDMFFKYIQPGCAGVFFNKNALMSIGGYPTEELTKYPDIYLLINYIRMYGVKYVKKIGCYYQIHTDVNATIKNAYNYHILKYERMSRMIPYISDNEKKCKLLKRKAEAAYRFSIKNNKSYWQLNQSKTKNANDEYNSIAKSNLKIKIIDFFLILSMQIHYFRTFF